MPSCTPLKMFVAEQAVIVHLLNEYRISHMDVYGSQIALYEAYSIGIPLEANIDVVEGWVLVHVFGGENYRNVFIIFKLLAQAALAVLAWIYLLRFLSPQSSSS